MLKDVTSTNLMSEEFDCKVTVRKNPDWKMYIAECITLKPKMRQHTNAIAKE
jgi:hypothetical protein